MISICKQVGLMYEFLLSIVINNRQAKKQYAYEYEKEKNVK
jgi:hypothetical protein